MDPRAFDGGPALLVLTASVARRYYVDGRSKVDIADEFQLSRFKVARLIESARTSGLVRIEIGYAGSIDVDLSGRLQEALGLRHALVVDSPEGHPETLRQQLGKAAADLLGEIVTAEDVLGLAWARAVSAMTASLTRLAADAGRPADRGARPQRSRRQLDRAGARGRTDLRRPGLPLLRTAHRPRRRDSHRHAPTAGDRRGFRPLRLGHQGGRGSRILGGRAVHAV